MPVAPDDAPAPLPLHAGAPAAHALPSATQTVLVVDDEPALRGAMRRMLERGGYRVLEATDGREALATCAQQADRIALVISDVVMPQMGGRAFLAQLHAGFPRARAILMSGYSEAAACWRDGTDGVPRLGKPFTAVELLALVRATLDTPGVHRRAS